MRADAARSRPPSPLMPPLAGTKQAAPPSALKLTQRDLWGHCCRIDDWGWADVGYHRPPGYGEIQSPNIDAIVKDGITLDRHYVFKFCSPTRSAIQSGRNPIHVNAQNVGMQNLDPENPLNGVSGIPVNMTGFAQRLADVGYKHRVFAGKADFGMAYAKSTPLGRG